LIAQNVLLAGNQRNGLVIRRNSSVIFRGGAIEGNGDSATLHSLVDMTGSTYVADNTVHDAVAIQDSAIRISSVTVNVNGLIHCGDDESSLETGGAGPIDTDCTGF
jgi:hypothetical protein